MEGVSFLHLGKFSHSFLSLDQLATFYAFNILKHFWEFHYCDVFARVPYGTSSPFSSQTLYSFILITLPPLNSPGYSSRVSWTEAGSTFPHSVISSITHFYSILILPAVVPLFGFFAALWSLLTNYLFWLSIFVKCCMGLSLGDGRQQSYSCPSVSSRDWFQDPFFPNQNLGMLKSLI